MNPDHGGCGCDVATTASQSAWPRCLSTAVSRQRQADSDSLSAGIKFDSSGECDVSERKPTPGRRWDDVEYHFYGSPEGAWDDAHTVLTGEAREHPGGIVISVQESDGPYVIRAVPSTLGGFAGRHEGLDGDAEVKAHWNSIGDRQVGVWLEDGAFYLFTFILKGFHRAGAPR